MNPDTGHLIRVENDEEMQHLVGYGYERVPENLEVVGFWAGGWLMYGQGRQEESRPVPGWPGVE